ncbi:MAG: hypothetical protein HETSPECPRED_000678 [Heterodermia speciosa]|uniref:Calcofluor white hypersensitive protein n=1 Tax=Heterodermia speciosa TaxID=116794 RepID=A0A8H3GD24_9LECA|nr:MAG: hypothetical protein HETSPECPRED_000678 [Heterodermia speciosa]
MAARSRILPIAAGAVALGGGYYFYTAGGDPKVAKKEISHDATTAANRLKGNDYSAKEAQKQGEEWAQKAGSKIDSTVDDARKQIHEADAVITQKAREAEKKVSNLAHSTIAQAQESAKETRKDANAAIQDFDKTVERKAAEAKSGISSWFGFGK